VCPFVPVSGASLSVCTDLARRLGARAADELGIPVYLYGEAATSPIRRNLAYIRRGEYEGLADRIRQPDFQPDFGPPVFNPRSGATAVGARDILIAFNVNLNTTDLELAREIARNIRTSGRKESADTANDRSGGLPAVRALGWWMAAYGCVQVSMNLLDWRVTPPHVAYEEVQRQAHRRGLDVRGSELVGLMPLNALLTAGRTVLSRQGRTDTTDEDRLIAVAVEYLGLESVRPFVPEERILEYRLRAVGLME
jgi:glutamate formiminotransferase/formiminotetrahydrofolate cyclodeaminase